MKLSFSTTTRAVQFAQLNPDTGVEELRYSSVPAITIPISEVNEAMGLPFLVVPTNDKGEPLPLKMSFENQISKLVSLLLDSGAPSWVSVDDCFQVEHDMIVAVDKR